MQVSLISLSSKMLPVIHVKSFGNVFPAFADDAAEALPIDLFHDHNKRVCDLSGTTMLTPGKWDGVHDPEAWTRDTLRLSLEEEWVRCKARNSNTRPESKRAGNLAV